MIDHDPDGAALEPKCQCCHASAETASAEITAPERRNAPRFPFNGAVALVSESGRRINGRGVNISGSGMDPNIIGRAVQGGPFSAPGFSMPLIRRIFVRGVTADSHGNAVGIGLADFTRTDVLAGIDWEPSYINALTALSTATVKIPIHFATDRQVIRGALESAAVPEGAAPKVVRILDTLNLRHLQASEAYRDEIRSRADLKALSEPGAMAFDSNGNLLPMNLSVAASSF